MFNNKLKYILETDKQKRPSKGITKMMMEHNKQLRIHPNTGTNDRGLYTRDNSAKIRVKENAIRVGF